jgi:D-alanine-D-alanine ligase
MRNEGILILFNTPAPETASAGGWRESDAGVLKEVRAVSDALKSLGLQSRQCGIRSIAELPDAVMAGDEDVVFNLVERLDGCECDFNLVPAVCRALGRSCTGADTPAMLLTFDKWVSKKCLQAAGLAVPAGVLWAPGAAAPAMPEPPLIVKPVRADGSEGIGPDSLFTKADSSNLRAACESIHRLFGQPALIEHYVEGRELNVSVIERDGAPLVLPVSEVDFSLFPPELPHIVDYAVKWRPGTLGGVITPRRVPAPLDDGLRRTVESAAIAAWKALGCRDYARIDFRLPPGGEPHVLEANANPDVSPLAGLPACLKAAGVQFPAFVAAMVGNAYARRGR